MSVGNSTLKETAGNLVMAGGKITGLGAGTVAGDGVRYEQAILTSGANAFAADQSMGSHKLTNVTDPASAQDAATKNYVDAKVHAFFGPWGNVQNPANTTQRFLSLDTITTTTPPTTETDSQMVAGIACTIAQIYINTVAAALATDTQTMTARVNGVNSAATATVSAGGSTANLTGQAVAVAATDLISIGYVESGTQTAANIKIRASLGVKV